MATLCRWLAFASFAALANAEPVQLVNLQLPSSASAHKQAVADLFNVSYTAYKTYAWGHDDLSPDSMSHSDGLDGWGATISDALDTMWLMGFKDWFKEAVAHVQTVDFSVSRTNSTVSLFETTIRHVGGLLSAYELSGKTYPVLLQKAEQVAQQLVCAWAGSHLVPWSNVNFTDHTPVKGLTSIATAGTLTLEWDRLSLYTGNDTYRRLAEQSVQHVIQMPSKVLPAMPAEFVDPSTGDPVGSYVSWGGGFDSYYEYLIKYSRLTNTDDGSYAKAWLAAVDSSIRVLLKQSTVGNWSYLADYDGFEPVHVGSHLACFYGGNWILGGKLTSNDTIVNIGLELTDACWNTYAGTATGIGPEAFAFMTSDGKSTNDPEPTAAQIQFYSEHGYYITESDYILRPEVLESNFYAWRATGNTKYLDHAARALQSFQTYLPATVAYGGIDDVDNTTSTKIDDMESFWFAETLKYLYLTFDDPSRMSLDHYVFNTEGHPFKAPKAKDIYGSV